MEIRIILDPNEVREILEKTGEVVLKPTAANVAIDARADRRGRPMANPPPVVAAPAPAPAPAPAAKTTKKAEPKKAEAPVVEAPEAPEAPEATSARTITTAEIQTALTQYAKKHGREATHAVLGKYGKTVASVKPESYPSLMADLTAQPEDESKDEW
jgi:hypothetical protein